MDQKQKLCLIKNTIIHLTLKHIDDIIKKTKVISHNGMLFPKIAFV